MCCEDTKSTGCCQPVKDDKKQDSCCQPQPHGHKHEGCCSDHHQQDGSGCCRPKNCCR